MDCATLVGGKGVVAELALGLCGVSETAEGHFSNPNARNFLYVYRSTVPEHRTERCPSLSEAGQKFERCTNTSDISTSAHISSTKGLTDAIELTWHRHLELRKELYELEMGPSDIPEVYLSCQKTVRSSINDKG
eukprot:scaffold7454_cov77-Cyclotella_meneghiniana.AAC.11